MTEEETKQQEGGQRSLHNEAGGCILLVDVASLRNRRRRMASLELSKQELLFGNRRLVEKILSARHNEGNFNTTHRKRILLTRFTGNHLFDNPVLRSMSSGQSNCFINTSER